MSFVIVPTPSDESGRFRNDFVVAALHGIGHAVAVQRAYHVVGVVSTVMPGSTEAVFASALARSSGLEIGSGIGLCYTPAFVALGSVIDDLTHPDLVLLGESAPTPAGDVLAAYYVACAPRDHRFAGRAG